jgi:hypothetical protein
MCNISAKSLPISVFPFTCARYYHSTSNACTWGTRWAKLFLRCEKRWLRGGSVTKGPPSCSRHVRRVGSRRKVRYLLRESQSKYHNSLCKKRIEKTFLLLPLKIMSGPATTAMMTDRHVLDQDPTRVCLCYKKKRRGVASSDLALKSCSWHVKWSTKMNGSAVSHWGKRQCEQDSIISTTSTCYSTL